MASCAAPGCTRDLPAKLRPARERAYCSDTCRARAARVRAQFQLALDVAELTRAASDVALLAALGDVPVPTLVSLREALSGGNQGSSYADSVTNARMAEMVAIDQAGGIS
jgi:hypothetical protein